MKRFIRTTSGLDAKRVRSRGARWRPASAWPSLLGIAVLASCGALVGGDATVGGETHFLLTCQDDCGPGLSCIEGVCTRGCEPGFSSCSELGASASCESVSESEDVGFLGTCEVRCDVDADCAPLEGGHDCRAGVCRAEPTSETPVGSSRAPLVHAVDPDTCESGLRWMGGDTPSAEMHPGSDCVGCHRDTGARNLLIGGTVYATGAFDAPRALDDCLGLEGVEVIVEDAVGRELRTVTNRAGNFYFEGDEADFELPYSAKLVWTREGESISPQMATTPMYGGCARCHGLEGDTQFPFELAPETPDYVQPTSDVFLPGLRPTR